MKKLGVVLALAFVAQGALANKAVSEEGAAPSVSVEAISGVAAVKADEAARKQTTATIEQGVDQAKRRLDLQIDRRISGMLDLSLLQ